MPKVDGYRIPNHDIEQVVDLIEEASTRASLTSETLDEETFQEEVIQRKGGSYSRYRFSLQLYGFLNREHGADEVEITERFVDVADPVPRSAKPEAISQAVADVPLLAEMYEEGFEPGFSESDLRFWLIQEMNVPRDEAQADTIEDLRELYEPAYPYLDEALGEAVKSDEQDEEESDEVEPDQDSGDEEVDTTLPSFGARQSSVGGDDQGELEMIRIGDKAVQLPKKNIASEWRMLKATVDAYINTMEEERDGD